MELATASGNNQKLFKVIRDIGGMRNSVSEVVCNRNEQLIHGRQRRVDCLTEYFKNQFRWSHANVGNPTIAGANTREVSLDSLTQVEVESNMRFLKRGKATGPDQLTQVLFKFDGEALI